MASPGQQLVQIDFSAGINEAVRDEAQDPGQGFLRLENIRKPQRGAAKKRYGYAALNRSALQGAPPLFGSQKLFSDGKAPCVVDSSKVYSYGGSSSKWAYRGRSLPVGYSVASVPAPSWLAMNVASVPGYYCVCAYRQASVLGRTVGYILDASAGVVVGGETQLLGNGSLYAHGVAGWTDTANRRTFGIVGTNISTGEVDIFLLNVEEFSSNQTSWTNNYQPISSRTASALALHGLEDRLVVAYALDAGTNRLAVKTYNLDGIIQSTSINTSSTTPDWIALGGTNADTLWVAWNEGTAVKVCGLTGNNLSVVKATTATAITAASATDLAGLYLAKTTAPGTGMLLVSQGATPNGYTLKRNFSTSAGAVSPTGSTSTLYNFVATSQGFTYDARTYVMGYAAGVGSVGTTNQQKVAFLCDVTDGVRAVASIFPGLASAWTYGTIATTSSASRFVTLVNVDKSQVADGAALVTFDFADPQRWKTAHFGASPYLTGALTHYFDGEACREAGFLHAPPKPTVTAGGTGVTLTVGRSYVAVYEDVDADGNWAISGISNPTSSGAVTNKTLTISTAPYTVGPRAALGNVRVAFYGTTDGGTTYYRLTNVYNDTTAATVSTDDSRLDTVIVTGAGLYSPNLPSTPGGALDRRGPPGLMHLTSYNGVLVGAFGSTLYYSGQYVEGEAPWFNPVFQVPVEGDGDITGLAALDGVLYVFKRDSVYTLAGEAPSDNGAQGGLGMPRRMAADVGCIDARSILLTSLGVFFQSPRGLEVVTRSGTVEWIGEPVRTTTAAYPVCTAATLDSGNRLALFELVTTESANQVSGTGVTLVYDLTLQQWVSVDKKTGTGGTASAPAQSAAMVWNGSAWRYAWLGMPNDNQSGGRVYVEDTATHLDAGSYWVTKVAETANVKGGGLQGQQFTNRALLLAKRQTGHDHAMKFAFDYSASYGTTRTWSASELASLASALPNMQLEMLPNDNASGEAVRLHISDATPSSGSVGTGEGATWIGVTFEVVPQPGAYKLPDASR